MEDDMGSRPARAVKLDSLRLIALGRIPRCGSCSRYRALLEAHDGESEVTPWPPAPVSCSHQVCGPLVSRFLAAPPKRNAFVEASKVRPFPRRLASGS